MSFRIPVHNTITTPSLNYIKITSSLFIIAALAKAAKNMELYNQAKEAHDNMVRQYNERNKPKEKGFWEQFKDNLTLNMDTHVTLFDSYLEEKRDFQTYCEAFKTLSDIEIQKHLKNALDVYNREISLIR